MKKLLFAGVAVFGLMGMAGFSFAADKTTVSGSLIDNACAAGQMKKDDPEAAAGAHPASCCKKEGCEKSGYSVIVGKKQWKFDDAGNKLAKEYLAKNDKVKVKIEGTPNEKEGTIEVASIKAAD